MNLAQKLPLIACASFTGSLVFMLSALNSRFWSFRDDTGSRSPFWDPNTDEVDNEFLLFKVPGIVAIVSCLCLTACTACSWVYLLTFRGRLALPEQKALRARVHTGVYGCAIASAALAVCSAVWWASALSLGLGWGVGSLAWSWYCLVVSALLASLAAVAWRRHVLKPYVPPPMMEMEPEDGRRISAGFDRRGRPRRSQDFDHLGQVVVQPAPHTPHESAQHFPGATDLGPPFPAERATDRNWDGNVALPVAGRESKSLHV